MLESIREGVKKPWVKIVIFAIVISFVFAGYFSGALFSGDPNAVAIVNGDSIGRNEFQNAYARTKAQQAEYYNANVKTEDDERNFQESVLQRLISIKVKDQAIEDLGLRLSATGLRDVIQSNPNYQVDGRYSRERVDQVKLSQGWSDADFKSYYMNQGATEQFMSGVLNSDFSLPKEVQSDYELLSQKRSGRALPINFTQFKKSIEITDEEINQYYTENESAFRVEEKVSVEYLELSVGVLQAAQQVTDEEVDDYYQENIDRYRTEEQRQISHILVLLNDDEDSAKSKIDSIKARIDGGEDFAAIAAAESDDIPTRESGGDLGVLLPGAMEEEIENAANGLVNVGDVSQPVKTEFGYHIIKLTAFVEGTAQPLDDVKTEIVSELKKAKAEEDFYAKSEALEKHAFEVSDSLDKAAEETGLEIKTSELFGQSNRQGLFANQDLKTAAFSSDVKEGGLNSIPVEIGDLHLVVLRVKEHQDSKVQPLEEVKDRVINSLKQSKSKQKAEKLANELLAKLEANEPADTLIEENKLKWTDLDKIERNNASLSYLTNQQFFRMPEPSEGEVSWDMIEDFQGFTILMLNQVEKGRWADAEDANKKQRSLYIGSYFANAGFTAFIEDKRKNSNVKRKPENLPR